MSDHPAVAHRPLITYLCGETRPPLDPAVDRGDQIAESMLQVEQARHKYDRSCGREATYYGTVASNQLRKQANRSRRHVAGRTEQPAEPIADQPEADDSRSPLFDQSRQYEVQCLYSYLRARCPWHCWMVLLARSRGYSWHTIAARWRRGVPRIQAWQQWAVSRLQQIAETLDTSVDQILASEADP